MAIQLQPRNNPTAPNARHINYPLPQSRGSEVDGVIAVEEGVKRNRARCKSKKLPARTHRLEGHFVPRPVPPTSVRLIAGRRWTTFKLAKLSPLVNSRLPGVYEATTPREIPGVERFG